ncbi:MAG: MBL fold metallo-hydrolase [Clostridia bacterium]|nr:MBL fold metallo-hydrolase [Clostridia bacterium]
MSSKKKRPISVSPTVVSAVVAVLTIIVVLIITSIRPAYSDATPEVILEGDELLTVYFLDVGEGDCAVIVTPENKTVMIDTGTRDNEQNVVDQLREFGVKTLDYLILTHAHTDHTGLASYIIERYSVKTLILPNLDDVSGFSYAVNAAKSFGTEIQRAVSPHTLNVGSVLLNFVFDGNDFVTDNSNSSIEILLQYKERSVLFTADNEKPVEDHLVSEYKNMKADVLKVAHHGSVTSTTQAFLDAVNPRYAVISVGRNEYGHPHESVTERLFVACEKVFRTDRDGAVKLVTDGKNIKFYTYSEDKTSQNAA